MADKISMLIVKVDLDCRKCYDKMRKILCKLQDQERIRTISFDDKSKTIAIAGPFDPQRLACKIRCRGGNVVKDIQIMDVGGGNGKPQPSLPDPVNNGGKKPKEKHPAVEPPPPQPSPLEPEPAPPPPDMPPTPPPQPANPDREMASTMPAFDEKDRPKADPAELEPPRPQSPKENPPVEYCMPPPAMKPTPPPCPMPPEQYYTPPALPPAAMKPRPPPPCPKPPQQYPAEYVIPTVEIPSWPAAPVGPCGCPCCASCYQGYYEGCRCGCGGGGRMYGCAASGPPPPAWYGYRGCRIINEEDPNAACSIM